MKTKLETYLRAGYPALFIVTPEEQRAEAEIKSVAEAIKRSLHVWSVTQGLMNIGSGTIRDTTDPLAVLEAIEILEPKQIVILKDFGLYFEDMDPVLIRKMRDVFQHAKFHSKTLILLGCEHQIPVELDRDIVVLPLHLPDKTLLTEVLHGILTSSELTPLSDEIHEVALDAAAGLTSMEAENSFALSIIESGTITPSIIAREKATSLKQGGLLEVIENLPTLENIGGLDELKSWLLGRRRSFSPQARQYGLPTPKGLLIVGVPGTGKSLTAKATASAFGLPLLRMDAGRIFAGIVGQSEANLRQVIATAEAISPCVLWIDELEKAFAGSCSSGSTDGGTSARVFGMFLSWIQEKEKPVFVVATANDVSHLPPELLRKGRFDEVFFVDLPSAKERADIWDIVIAKYGRSSSSFDRVRLAQGSELYTGAEIEQIFVDALHLGFSGDREVTEMDIGMALVESVPLANLMSEEIERLRRWSQCRTRSASASHRLTNGLRKLER